jgi:hypothetical protein
LTIRRNAGIHVSLQEGTARTLKETTAAQNKNLIQRRLSVQYSYLNATFRELGAVTVY